MLILCFSVLFPPHVHPLWFAFVSALFFAFLVVSVLYASELFSWKQGRKRPFFFPFGCLVLCAWSSVFHAPYLWAALSAAILLTTAFVLYLQGRVLMAQQRWKLTSALLAIVAAWVAAKSLVEWSRGAEQLLAYYQNQQQGLSLRMQTDLVHSLSQGRALSFYGNPNHLASVLMMLLPMLWVLYEFASSRVQKAAVVVLALPSLMTVYATYSRAGAAMAGLVIVATVWVWIRRHCTVADENSENQVELSKRARLFGLLCLIALGLLALSGFLIWRLELMGGRFFNVLTLKARGEFYLAAMKMIALHPWRGNGLGAYEILYPQFRLLGGVEARHPHNLFLQVWVEGGIVYLVAWVWLVLAVAWKALGIFLKPAQSAWQLWQRALLTGGLLFLIHSQVDFVNNMAFFLFFFALSLSQLENQDETTNLPDTITSDRRVHIVSAVLFLILSLGWVLYIYRPAVAQTQFDSALMFAREGRHPEAFELYSRARKNNPWNANSAEHLALTAMQMGMPEKALHEARQAVSLNPLTPHLHQSLGRILTALGRIEEAESAFQRASQLHPNKPDYYLDLANLYKASNRETLSEQMSKTAAEVDKGYSGSWTVTDARR